MSQKISDEELIIELKRIIQQTGKAPTRYELDKLGKYSSNAYKRAFGNLTNAMKICGAKPTQIKNNTKEDALLELKRIYKELGRIPTIEEFSKLSSMSYVTLRNLLDQKPWHAILKDIGVPDEEMIHLKKHNVTEEELREDMLRLTNILGRYPTYMEMGELGKFSCNTYENRFGSWSNSFKALGFDDYVSQSVYKKQIHSKGIDGTTYKSKFESKYANLFHEMKNNNEIKNYEYERNVCENKSWTCDFVLTNNDDTELWIELDGMMEHRRDPYDENNEKIQYYKANNIDFTIIEYSGDLPKKEAFIK